MQDSLAAWHLQRAAAAHAARRPRALRSTSRSPTSPRCGCATDDGHRQAARRRHAVVHDRLRPRHAHHVPADDAVRPGAARSRRSTRSPRSRRRRTTRRSTPSRARSCTSCAAAARPRPGSAPTTAPSTRRRSSSSCSPRSGAGRTTPALVERLREPALAALALDRRVRRPRRRRLRRVRAADAARAREPVVEGLGRLAALPRRLAREDARSRRPRCRATSTTRSSAWPSSRAPSGATSRSPTGSRREAAELRRRFDEPFWVEERGGYYALALDGDKRPVDSLCSNIGHLLWSGIVPPERVEAIVDQLMGDELWSGWGVRTMSTGDAAYNPLSYHNGTVWPHDTSLSAWGLRAQRPLPATSHRIARRCSRRRGTSTGRCPRSSPASAARDAVPDRVSDGRAAAGVGRGHAGAAAAAPARARARPGAGRARARLATRTRVAGRARARRRPRVRTAVGRRRCGRPRQRGDGLRCASPSSARSGSPCRRPATAGSSGSSRCSPTGSPTPATTSRSSRRATRARARSSTAVFEEAPSERIGQTFWELQHALNCFARHDDFDVIHDHTGLLGLALGSLLPTPLVHTVHGPLDGHPGDLYEQVVADGAAREADLALA